MYILKTIIWVIATAITLTLLIKTSKNSFCDKTHDNEDNDDDSAKFLMTATKTTVLAVAIIFSCGGVVLGIRNIETYIVNINSLKTYRNELNIYEEENKKIAEEIEIAVKNYLDYEETIINSATSRNPLFLAEHYPELKSSELIKTQLDVYKANAEEIKKSKARLSQEDQWRWLLYFGGKK